VPSDWVFATGILGPEDFELDLGNAVPRLLVSSQDRRPKTPPPGGIFAVEIRPEGFGAVTRMELVGRDAAPFHPHGISLVLRPSSSSLLYVINHAEKDDHRIEMFRVEGSRLIAEGAPLKSELFKSPNDLVALQAGGVYVTNSTGKAGLLGKVEQLLGLAWSNVVRLRSDGQWEIAAKGIRFANGIAVNAAGDTVYVSATRGRGIHVFPRNQSTGALGKQASFIRVPSGVDNLLWENPTTLNVTGHPDLLAFVRHYRSAARNAPSDIFRVDVQSGRARLVFRDDGSRASAASTALHYGGRWYLGRVFDDGVASCKA